mmetsp:Transcript_15240/g.26645  ORF Transcript_15240/g.26645 Transcript_15240/m.26645 type:complete len:99 (-) Transcript_15240:343-639(-)
MTDFARNSRVIEAERRTEILEHKFLKEERPRQKHVGLASFSFSLLLLLLCTCVPRSPEVLGVGQLHGISHSKLHEEKKERGRSVLCEGASLPRMERGE